jgi:hypothetical protein
MTTGSVTSSSRTSFASILCYQRELFLSLTKMAAKAHDRIVVDVRAIGVTM